jgi:hypothetical protein
MDIKIYPNGIVLYCPECGEYICQSDPQDDSRRKTVVIDDQPCTKCVTEAQTIMGRLGLPKGEANVSE